MPHMSLGSVAEAGVKLRYNRSREIQVVALQVIAITSDFAAAHLVGVGIIHVARLEQLRVILLRGFHLLHVPELRELQRMRERVFSDFTFADAIQYLAKLLVRRGVQILIS